MNATVCTLLFVALLSGPPGAPTATDAQEFPCTLCGGKGGYNEVYLGSYEAGSSRWSECYACRGTGRWRSPGPNRDGLAQALQISRWNHIACLIWVGQPFSHDVESAVNKRYRQLKAWPMSVEVSEYEGDAKRRLVILLPVVDPAEAWRPAKLMMPVAVVGGIAKPGDIGQAR